MFRSMASSKHIQHRNIMKIYINMYAIKASINGLFFPFVCVHTCMPIAHTRHMLNTCWPLVKYKENTERSQNFTCVVSQNSKFSVNNKWIARPYVISKFRKYFFTLTAYYFVSLFYILHNGPLRSVTISE